MAKKRSVFLAENLFFANSKSRAASSRSLAFFCFSLMAGLVFSFYTTPLRDHLENKLYDLRMRLKPDVSVGDDVAIVEINDRSVSELEPPQSRDLSYKRLEEIVARLQTFGVRAVVVLLYPNVFSYTSEAAERFSENMSDQENVYFGVMGLDTPVPSGRDVPERLQAIRQRTAGLEIFRDRRHDFVRRLNFFAHRGLEKRALLPLFLVENLTLRYRNVTQDFDRSFLLNYLNPELFYRVRAEDLLVPRLNSSLSEELNGRVVFVGYTSFRNRPINSNQIFVNTPWQAEGEDPKNGMPLVYVTAMAYLNQLHGRWLDEGYAWIGAAQATVVFFFSALIWGLGVSRAVFLFIGGWLALLYLHALLASYANIIIPLADTALFSAIGVLSGSVWRLRVEGSLSLAKETKAATMKNLAQSQSEFLLAFTRELTDMNSALVDNLQDYATRDHDADKRIVGKIQAAAEDFRDYLKGMDEFARLEDSVARRARKEPVAVRQMVQRLLQQFAYRSQEQEVSVELDIAPDLQISSDETLLELVVFNLVSNAVKYTPRGEVVSITAGKDAELGPFITVKDRGPGIAKEYQKKVFKKFYRISDSAHHTVKGSGLGLYLSKYLARRLGVRITIDSEPGKGASFTIRFGAK